MQRDLKEDFFRLDGAWASFELMSIRRREDYLKPFRVIRCKIDDQVNFDSPEQVTGLTEASVLVDIFGTEEQEVGMIIDMQKRIIPAIFTQLPFLQQCRATLRAILRGIRPFDCQILCHTL